jgi:hypothetical protein
LFFFLRDLHFTTMASENLPSLPPLTLLLLLATTLPASCGDGLGVFIEHPQPGAEFSYIPDIPLWLRIRVEASAIMAPRTGQYCFEVLLNGESQTMTCDRDTILSGVIPPPGTPRASLR